SSLIVIATAAVLLLAAAATGIFNPKALPAQIEQLFASLHWSFWGLLLLCAAAAGVRLWQQGAFSMVKIKLPGMDTYDPIDSSRDSARAT
ncbi:hypothetical protein ABTQ07_20560, partial [Acinetobacter baumannii]